MMTRYPNYLAATNAAYKLLLDLKINKVPIDLNRVINKLPNVKLKTYGDICRKRGMSFDEFIRIAENDNGFLIKRSKNSGYQYIIAYNEMKDIEIRRFTIAHELGHIILGHTIDDKISEKEANCFTRNFLCPIPVSIEKQLYNRHDYVNTYNISPIAADVSIHFRHDDYKNITMDNYFDVSRLFGVSFQNDQEDMIDLLFGNDTPHIIFN